MKTIICLLLSVVIFSIQNSYADNSIGTINDNGPGGLRLNSGGAAIKPGSINSSKETTTAALKEIQGLRSCQRGLLKLTRFRYEDPGSKIQTEKNGMDQHFVRYAAPGGYRFGVIVYNNNDEPMLATMKSGFKFRNLDKKSQTRNIFVGNCPGVKPKLISVVASVKGQAAPTYTALTDKSSARTNEDNAMLIKYATKPESCESLVGSTNPDVAPILASQISNVINDILIEKHSTEHGEETAMENWQRQLDDSTLDPKERELTRKRVTNFQDAFKECVNDRRIKSIFQRNNGGALGELEERFAATKKYLNANVEKYGKNKSSGQNSSSAASCAK